MIVLILYYLFSWLQKYTINPYLQPHTHNNYIKYYLFRQLYQYFGFNLSQICKNTDDELLELMSHDKKSRDGAITCTLLTALGDYRTGMTVSRDGVTAALDILRDQLGV